MHHALSRARIIIDCGLTLFAQERRRQYRTLQIVQGGIVS